MNVCNNQFPPPPPVSGGVSWVKGRNAATQCSWCLDHVDELQHFGSTCPFDVSLVFPPGPAPPELPLLDGLTNETLKCGSHPVGTPSACCCFDGKVERGEWARERERAGIPCVDALK